MARKTLDDLSIDPLSDVYETRPSDYQRTLVSFQSHAKSLKRGLAAALFIQRFKLGLLVPDKSSER